MNLLLALASGLTAAVLVFLLLASLCVPGFFKRALRVALRPLILSMIAVWALMMTAAVTQINLATQVYGTLPTASVPAPTASTLGGIESITSAAHNWIAYIDTSGVPHQSQPNYTDLAGVLPNPGASSLGGIESLDCTGSGHIVKISTSGVPTCAADGGANQNQVAPTGSINGSNTSFTLSPTPTVSANANCFLNGVQQRQGAGTDYTISGATITYLTAPPTNTTLWCLWY